MSHRLTQLRKAFFRPDKAVSFVYRKFASRFSQEELEYRRAFANIREPKKQGTVSIPDQVTQSRILQQLAEAGVAIKDYEIDFQGYRSYQEKADYGAYRSASEEEVGLQNKMLQHYVAAELLNLNELDVYIDIASCASPAPKLYTKIYGCRSFWQDLGYPPGFDGDMIGGDAGDMPVPDQFATKMALHCSYEHFVGNSDIAFLKEAARVLKPGGEVCILPLYLSDIYSIQTNPVRTAHSQASFESDATLFCVKGWYDHGRHYDVQHLTQRIRNNLGPLEMTIYHVINRDDLGCVCWLTFIAVLRKPVE